MSKHLDPKKAFPDEVLALQKERGVPLPSWFAGPLYSGNGTESAIKELQQAREAAVVQADDPTGTAKP